MATEQTPIWIQLVIPALTAVSATLGTLFVSQWKAVKDAKEVSASEQAATRLKFLDPLRLATEDLTWKWWVIEGKIREHRPGSGGLDWMVNTFHCIKEPQEILHRPLSEKEFCFWCNGEGFFSVSAIYVTAVYFHHAWRTRREYIIDKELIMKLDTVRV